MGLCSGPAEFLYPSFPMFIVQKQLATKIFTSLKGEKLFLKELNIYDMICNLVSIPFTIKTSFQPVD